jgi:RAT1-interacting protein
MKFWIQSSLGGVPTIVVGFRNDDGFVSHLHRMKTVDIPEKCHTYWDSSKCIYFLERVLDRLKSLTKNGNIYKLSCNNGTLKLEKNNYANNEDYEKDLNNIIPKKYQSILLDKFIGC